MKKNSKLRTMLRENNVTLMFIALCIGAFIASSKDVGLTFLLPELFTRIGRNAFLVLSLLIPVVAGMGLNFGIVIGAIAAQISIFFVVLWGFTGMTGFLLCVVISTPLSIVFGWMVGKLFNSMKGTEMIGGLVAGYFSDGLYQFLFLFLLGGVIPIASKSLMLSTGTGVKNTINLKDNLKYALDNVPMLSILDFAFYAVIIVSVFLIVYRLIRKRDLRIVSILKVFLPISLFYALSFIPTVSGFLSSTRLLLLNAIEICVVIAAIYCVVQFILIMSGKSTKHTIKDLIIIAIVAGAAYALTYVKPLYEALIVVHLPVMTYLCIAALYLFIPWLMNTKLGQSMRTAGQNRTVASSSGINVDRIRIIATIISTILASYGQLISLQNIGTLATYGAHTNVGLYAVAALLVGGASVHRATTKQAMIGLILFHTLFILSPIAGKAILKNAQVGEYFRVFIAYGVIAVSLAMHAWSMGKEKAITALTPEMPLPMLSSSDE